MRTILLIMIEKHPLLEQLASRIREARNRRKWSIRLLAEKSGVSPRFLTTLESGAGNISVVRLAAVCEALHLPLHELFAPKTQKKGVIALVGLRGAGKSTVGRALGKHLSLSFTELDSLIEEEAGMSLSQVFSLHGEAYYRRLEHDTLQSYLAHNQSGILSTGGGIVTHDSSLQLLTRECTTIWLQASPEEHMNRVLNQGDSRPVAGRSNAMDELRDLLSTREHLYQQAELHISTSQRPLHDSLQDLMMQLDGDNLPVS